MLPSLLTRRGGALRSCLQQCGSKQQLLPLPSFLRITESTVSHPRCMFATSRQLASKKTRFVQKKSNSPSKPVQKNSNSSSKPARAALPNVPEIIPTYTSYVDNIALHKSPTLLFQSSSHIGYLVGCYTLGGLCFAYSVINFNNYYLHPPDGVWAPVPIFLGGLAVFMIGVGVFFCRRPVRYVRTINAVPSQSESGPPALLLRIEVAPMIPLIPRKQLASITVPRGDVTLLSSYERDHKLALTEAKETSRNVQHMRALNKRSFMTSPFRVGSHLLGRGFKSFRSLFSSERFVFMRIKGKGVWKLNTKAAWALADGKAIDRLIKHI